MGEQMRKVRTLCVLAAVVVAAFALACLLLSPRPPPHGGEGEDAIIASTVSMELPAIACESLFDESYLDAALEDAERLVNSTLQLPRYGELSLQFEYMLDDLANARQAYEAGLYDEALAYVKQCKGYAVKIAVYVELKEGGLNETECLETVLRRVTALRGLWRVLKARVLSLEKGTYRIDDYLAWVPDVENKMFDAMSLLNQTEHAVALYRRALSNATEERGEAGRPAIAYLATAWSLAEGAGEYMDEVDHALRSIPGRLREENRETGEEVERLISEIRNETVHLFKAIGEEASNGTYALVLLKSAEGYVKRADELLASGFKAAALLDYISARALLHAADIHKNTMDPWLHTAPDAPSAEEVWQAKRNAVQEMERAVEKAQELQENGVNPRLGLKLLRELPTYYIYAGDTLLSRYLETGSNWRFLGAAAKIMYTVAEACTRASLDYLLNTLNAGC